MDVVGSDGDQVDQELVSHCLQVANQPDQLRGGGVKDDHDAEAAVGEAFGKALIEDLGVQGAFLVVADDRRDQVS